MGRRNRRDAKPQARRDKFGNTRSGSRPPAPPLEKMVLPTGTCPSKKLRFATEAEAIEALKQAQQRRARTGSGRIERRIYGGPKDPCLRGCGGYHLTSREQWQKRESA